MALAPFIIRWGPDASSDMLRSWAWCYGKTPIETFIDTLPVAKEKLMQAA